MMMRVRDLRINIIFVSLYVCNQEEVEADHFIKRPSQSNHNVRDFFTYLIGIYKIM